MENIKHKFLELSDGRTVFCIEGDSETRWLTVVDIKDTQLQEEHIVNSLVQKRINIQENFQKYSQLPYKTTYNTDEKVVAERYKLMRRAVSFVK